MLGLIARAAEAAGGGGTPTGAAAVVVLAEGAGVSVMSKICTASSVVYVFFFFRRRGRFSSCLSCRTYDPALRPQNVKYVGRVRVGELLEQLSLALFL